jgi:cytoskeleton protein RodZ
LSSSVSNSPGVGDDAEGLPPRPLGPGGRLARIRRDKGIAVDDVVTYLKYAPRQIEALEADHYDALPPASVVRGMVRGYAKLLGVEPEPLLEELRSLFSGPPPEVVSHVMDVPFQTKRGASHWVWWVVPGLVAIAIIAFGIEYFLNQRELGVLKLRLPAATRPAGTAGTAALPAAESPAQIQADSGGAGTAGLDARAMSGSRGTSAATIPGGMAASASLAAGTAAASGGPTRSAMRRIYMHCDNRAWVEVRSGDGQILVSQVLDAGSEKTVEGKPPFNVVIGAAHGVALIYEGEPVNLAPYTVVDVARLSLN